MHFLHVTDKTEPAAVNGADKALGGPVVAEDLARRPDAAAQCGVRNTPTVPDTLNDLVLAERALPIGDQQDQKVENLRLDGNKCPVTTHFVCIRVDQVCANSIRHRYAAH